MSTTNTEETSVVVKWNDPEQTAILYELAPKWTLDDLYLALQTGYEMLDGIAPKPIDIIIDARQARMVPVNITAAASYSAENRRSNSRKLVVLTTNPLIRSSADLINRLSPREYQKFAVVETEDEMRAYLEG